MSILNLIPVVAKIIDHIIPDPVAAAEAKQRAFDAAQKGELAYLDADTKLALGQMEINKVEAASESLFKSGWRPAVGWVGAVSLGLVYIPKALVMTAMWAWQAYIAIDIGGAAAVMPAYPDLGLTDLLGLLGSLLGFGVLRQRDKEIR